ncbi:MAG TPA: hypothetical protein VN604_02565 [Nitrospirota bacterium]|nr:hypothetical protein [Nitrospirota bacterium]
MKQCIALVFVLVLASALFAGGAEAAGTINVTFKKMDSNGVESPLPNSYIYLQPGLGEPPRELFFVNAAYIFGPSDANGRISASIPEGKYYIRITARNSSENRPYGPPEAGDHTWSQTNPLTVATNTIIDLGTKYASPFGSAPIVISGTVTSYNGTPLAGRYVRAQSEPCIQANGYEGTPSNHCGHEKHIALPTDENGKYTLYLKNPGTFYLYAAKCVGDQGHQYTGNPCMGVYGGTDIVNPTDQKTVNFVAY